MRGRGGGRREARAAKLDGGGGPMLGRAGTGEEHDAADAGRPGEEEDRQGAAGVAVEGPACLAPAKPGVRKRWGDWSESRRFGGTVSRRSQRRLKNWPADGSSVASACPAENGGSSVCPAGRK